MEESDAEHGSLSCNSFWGKRQVEVSLELDDAEISLAVPSSVIVGSWEVRAAGQWTRECYKPDERWLKR